MSTYRGKRFKPSGQDEPTNMQNLGGASHQQGTPRDARNQGLGQQPATGKRQASRQQRRATAAQASLNTKAQAHPQAFKHHDALYEDGSASHSKRKTLLIAIPVIIVVVAAIVAGGFAVSSFFASSEESTATAGIAVTVDIPQGASTNEIANILKEKDVIANTKDFISEVKTRGVEQSLKPGTYEMETLMDTSALIDLLVTGPIVDEGIKLTIPEGLTAQQTALVVQDALGIPQEDFINCVYAASSYAAEYPFLEGVYNNSLEGFLYPKTYSIPEDATADTVVRILLDQFALETANLDMSTAEAGGMNLFNVVTAASLIEKETAADDERNLIASVIYNRLSDGMKLQIDATVIYALGASYSGEPLTYADLEVDSPYNTYQIYELPAGPICSPSIASIEAAANPADTNYYYYVLTSKEGYHTFCETEDEFYVAKEEYERLFGIE